MNIFYYISASSVTEGFLAKIYEASAPTAEVDSIVIPAPHTLPQSITFSGRDKVTHIVKLIGATSGIVYHSYDVEPTSGQVTVFDPIFFKIGNGAALTPVAGTSSYTNILLNGLAATDFIVERTGYGKMVEGLHYTYDPNGGIINLPAPDVFGADEEWWIFKNAKSLVTPINDSVVGKMFGPGSGINDIFIDVVSTVNFTAAHLRKLIRLAGENAIYVFPIGAAIPIGYIFRITNFGAYGALTPLPKVVFNNAALKWGNTTKTELNIPLYNAYEFVFDGSMWNCTAIDLATTAQTASAFSITHIGQQIIGDIFTDSFFLIAIPNQGVTNYKVFGTLVGLSAVPNNDNDVMFVVYDKQASSFRIAIREVTANKQNLVFDYMIVK